MGNIRTLSSLETRKWMKRFTISSATIPLVSTKRSTIRSITTSIIRRLLPFPSTSISMAPRLRTWPIEAWMRKSGVLLTKRSLALMVKRELHLLQKRMVHWVVGTTLKRSITESTTRTQKTKDQMSLSEEWMRKFMVSLLTLFPHLTPLSEALMLSFQMVPIHLLSRELPSVLESIIRSITANIIRDQMSLSEEWTRKSMVSLLTLFPHLTPLSEALLHSCQMVLMNLLSRVLHSTREDTTATRDQMSLSEEWTRKSMVSLLTLFPHLTPLSEALLHSCQMVLMNLLSRELHSTREDTTTNITREILLREVWMRKSMVSLLTPFHHSTPELEALCHSFQTAQTHLPTMVSLSLQRDQMLPKEVWMRKSTVSVPTPFHHSTPDLEANCHSFQTALTHQPTHHLANLTLPLREDTTADITRDQISMREEWTRKSMVSLPTLFHHSTAGKEALNHSFQMVPTHLLMIATSWQEDIETLPREVWTLMFGDSPLRPFHQ